MITKKSDLKRILKLEKQNYFTGPFNKYYILDRFTQKSNIIIWKYQKLLRKEEYYWNNKKNFFKLLMYLFISRKKQKLGIKLGFSIEPNVFDEGLIIYHYGSIVVNGLAKVGKNCKLHGNNCIGNKGSNIYDVPTISDNVDIGFGAVIIGKVFIEKNCIVGSQTLINHDVKEENSIIVGIPGRRIN